VLVLLPPSKTMASIRRGKPLDPAGLSFPPLTPTRDAVLEALVEVSARPDATQRLGEPASMSDVVGRNVALRAAPTASAEAVYSGVLYDALGLADLDAAARRRARAWIVVISALWGAVRLRDRIPPYRLDMCGRLPGLMLSDVLPEAAGRGLVVDCRSAEYATAWRPTGSLADRTVVVKALRRTAGGLSAVSHNAKHTRGLVVRRIVTDGLNPRRPEGLAEALSEHFELELQSPARPGRPWELQVVEHPAESG
jgi:cytoplasmic iron level regulating protein YaaA (DUF328/UPF0246 family)